VRVGGRKLVEQVGDLLELEIPVVGDRHDGHEVQVTAEMAGI
jgi:hypothetical protein